MNGTRVDMRIGELDIAVGPDGVDLRTYEGEGGTTLSLLGSLDDIERLGRTIAGAAANYPRPPASSLEMMQH